MSLSLKLFCMNGESGYCRETASVPLPNLPAGCGGTVESLALPPKAARRLRQMGLCEGRWIRVIATGSRMIVEVLATRIGLHLQLAQAVHVSHGPPCPCLTDRLNPAPPPDLL